MKNLIYILGSLYLLTLALSCGNDSSNDKNIDNETVTKAPSKGNGTPSATNEEIDNNNDAANTYSIPAELSYMRKKEGFSYDKFYPIGWSNEGKFAYIVEPAPENSGMYFFEIHIYDIVNNRDLLLWKPEELETGSVSSVWKENADFISQSLNEYHIVQTKNFALTPSKFKNKGNDYEIIMDSKLETDEDFGIDILKGVKLTMKSPQLGSKDFYEQKMYDRDYILSAYIPGVLISPRNNLVAVLYQKERIGAGGPPNVVFFEIIGTNLDKEFIKADMMP